MKSSLILYPQQLFAPKQPSEVDTVFLLEDPLLLGLIPYQRRNIHYRTEDFSNKFTQ